MESRARTDQVKQLGELLQEEQEPFVLEVYVSERWYGNRSESLRRSSSGGRPPASPRKSTARLPKLLGTLYEKFASFNVKRRSKNGGRGGETGVAGHTTEQEAAEAKRYSLSSDVTTSFSCSESDKEGKPTSPENEHASFDPICLQNLSNASIVQGEKDTTIPWSVEKDEEQLNHVSATKQANYLAPLRDWQQDLQRPPARREANAPTCKIVLPIKTTEDSVFSASILDILFHCLKDEQSFTRTEEASQASDSSPSYGYLSSKMILQQTKLLLFDFVKEIIETHERKEKEKPRNRVTLGPEEIGKLVYDKIVAWGRTSTDETSTTELFYSDYFGSVEEWENCVPQKTQISSEVGDAIIEEMANEIVLDMVDLQLQRM